MKYHSYTEISLTNQVINFNYKHIIFNYERMDYLNLFFYYQSLSSEN